MDLEPIRMSPDSQFPTDKLQDFPLEKSCSPQPMICSEQTATEVLNCVPEHQWRAFSIEEEMCGPASNYPPMQKPTAVDVDNNTSGQPNNDQALLDIQKAVDKEILRIYSHSGRLIGGLDIESCLKLIGIDLGVPSIHQLEQWALEYGQREQLAPGYEVEERRELQRSVLEEIMQLSRKHTTAHEGSEVKHAAQEFIGKGECSRFF